jgi:hypothetical protein
MPWSAGAQLVSDGTTQRLDPGIARLTTTPGQVLSLRPPAA